MTKISKSKKIETSNYLDTEGLKEILLPVLYSRYPKDAIDLLKSDNFILGGTPYFTYIYLLQKYDFLLHNTDFKDLTIKERLSFLIFDRGEGNGTAYTQQQKNKMLNINVTNYNDVIFTMIDCEQSQEGSFGYPWNLNDFKLIAKEIEKAYLDYRGLKTIEI